MVQMGFGSKWIFWIKGCLSSSRASVLINGSAIKEFSITRGVRQGDPLSLFLFIIAMEGLNAAIRSACQHSFFHGVKLPNGEPMISHFFYADDALFVGEWSSLNPCNIGRIIRCFYVTLGLKVNFHKSKVFGIGVNEDEVSTCTRILGCEAASFPFIYLGVLVGANMSIK